MRWLLLAWLLPLLACIPRIPAPRPQERAAQRLLHELRERWARGPLEPLALLFAPECRVGCAGFVPTPTQLRPGEGEVIGQWWPRLVAGTLVGDLALVRRSYATIARLELATLAVRVYHLAVVLRVRLLVEGRDPAGRALRDRGELDLELRETPAGLRIVRLEPRRVIRSVTLLAEERSLAASSAPSSQPGEPEAPTSEPAEAEPAEPAEPAPETEPAPARQRLGELEVLRAGTSVRLRALAGVRATLLWVEQGAPSPATCEELAKEARLRASVAAVALWVGRSAPPRGARCAIPVVRPSEKSLRALEWLRPLLPALLLLDGAGELRRVAGAGAGRLELYEAIDRL